MEALLAPVPSAHFSIIPTTHHKPLSSKPRFLSPKLNAVPILSISPGSNNISKSKVFSTISSSFPVSAEEEPETAEKGEEKNFDWSSQWYPVMPVCDLDKRVPHAKRVMGLDIVVWWDRNESEWRVFNDACPHRLAPLSEGRIDQRGRLQCVYHGWCFNGSGECKFIPQAPPDGPLVPHIQESLCSCYPSTLQNNILWFWPNTSPEYKHILLTKQPPYISELDDPSYTKVMTAREFPFGYETVVENLVDPAHIPYAHYKLLPGPPAYNRVKLDKEGGAPIDLTIRKSDINGFRATRFGGFSKFIAPCVYFSAFSLPSNQGNVADQVNGSVSSDGSSKERKMIDVGPSNWQKAYFVPTKSDAQVVAFRKWLQKYSGGQINWGGKFSGALPPTPPKEQLMDRYWSHVVNCRSCSLAYKGFNALEIMLQVISIGSIGVDAATKQNLMSAGTRTSLVFMAILCFAASRWLSRFIYKNFHFHVYSHALL